MYDADRDTILDVCIIRNYKDYNGYKTICVSRNIADDSKINNEELDCQFELDKSVIGSIVMNKLSGDVINNYFNKYKNLNFFLF